MATTLPAQSEPYPESMTSCGEANGMRAPPTVTATGRSVVPALACTRVPSAGLWVMWSRASTDQLDTLTGVPQVTGAAQLSCQMGAPPTNMCTLPRWSTTVTPLRGVAGPALITAWVVGRGVVAQIPSAQVACQI